MADNNVVSQKGALVGDEAVQAKVHEVKVEVNDDAVNAQVAPAREKDAAKVSASETSVQLDRVITDPSAPEAVQVPDAGRGDSSLPIQRLSEPTPEDVFASEASEVEDSSDDEPSNPS